MIAGIGVDSIEIERIEGLIARSGDRFLQRVYTPAEQAYCNARARPGESYAARFCAKEAVMKCLGTGWADGLAFAQIEIVRDARGDVRTQLRGAASEHARQTHGLIILTRREPARGFRTGFGPA